MNMTKKAKRIIGQVRRAIAADKARKASAALGFFTALSMLIGAFIASVAAAYAGQLRDENADLSERI